MQLARDKAVPWVLEITGPLIVAILIAIIYIVRAHHVVDTLYE